MEGVYYLHSSQVCQCLIVKMDMTMQMEFLLNSASISVQIVAQGCQTFVFPDTVHTSCKIVYVCIQTEHLALCSVLSTVKLHALLTPKQI
jgi:hypothetical protein